MATDVVIAVGTRGVSAAVRSITRLEDRSSKFGKVMAGAVVGGSVVAGAALAKFTAASVNLEAKYSQTMATIQSATGASGRAMAKMNAMALKLGADTSFSASDAADAMLELAKAGVTTRNIMRGGVAGTLQLAAAGGTELATAATIASNAMNSFNLGGTEMASVAAALAGGANASSASVESLGLGLAQVGAGAVNAGLNLQETVAALAAFDNAGVKGSDAGTSLKTMLARLVPNTVKAKDAMRDLGLDFTKSNGEFVSLANVSEQLKQRLGRLSAEQRTAALNTIFGSDATRAASILMRQGAAGIQKYIKATEDQGAAQKMAEARMSGTAGSLERLSGAVETAQLRLGQELAPTVQKVADGLADNAVPAMEAAIDAGESLADTLTPAANAAAALGRAALDAGQFVAGLPGPVKEVGVQAAIAALILPRLTTGVTAVTSSLTMNIARLQQWRAEMTYSTTRAQSLAATMSRLGAAARTAAGIGGMVALTQAAGESNKGLQALEQVGGGALLGFSVGGPIGAAVGGTAGALLSMKQSADRAKESMTQAEPPAANYAASLDKITGAATKASREVALLDLQQRGALPAAAQLGVTQRDLVGAALGQEGALKRVNAVLNETTTVSGVTVDAFGNITATINGSASPAAQKLSSVLGIVSSDLADQAAKTRDSARATERLSVVYKGVPRDVITRIRQVGGDVTMKELRKLSRQVELTPKTVRIIARQNNIELTAKQVRNLTRDVKDAGKVKPPAPDLAPWMRGLRSALTGGRREAGRGAEGVARELGRGTKNAKADLSGFNSSLRQGVATSKQWASAGGKQTGNALGQGIYGGVDVWADPIASRAAAIVSAAVAAAKRAGKVNSPSVVMRDEVGMQLGAGIAVGLERSAPRVKVASFGIVQAIVEGLSGTDSSTPVDSAINDVVSRIESLYGRRLDQATGVIGRKFGQLGKQVEARFDANERRIRKKLKGKAEDKALRRNDAREARAERALAKAQQQAEAKLAQQNAARRKAALAIVARFTPALRANALAQEKINEKLEDAKSALAQLKEQHASYVTQVRDNVVSFGSIIGLGEGEGFGSVDQMLAKMRAKVAQAREYADLIKSLTAAGLNQTTIQQLIDAGVEGGLGTAQALASGGPAAIAEVNSLTSQLAAVGTDLGTKTADTLYGAGIAAGQALVDSLSAQQALVVAEGNRLAAALDAALAAATAGTAAKNHKSGKNIGSNLVAGLLDGVDGNQAAVDKAARKLGNALVRAVKDELGIKSPSRVFRGIGENVIKGLDVGLDDTYVRRTGAQLAASLQKGFGAQRLEAMVTASVSAGGSAPAEVRFSAQEVDQLARGRTVTRDGDAWASLRRTP